MDILYSLYADILKISGQEKHGKAEKGEESVYWETGEFLTDDEGELRIVTIETVPFIPTAEENGRLPNPSGREAIFERQDVWIIKKDDGGKLVSRLIIGRFGQGGAILSKMNGDQEERADFPLNVYNSYKKLAKEIAEVLE